MLFKNIQAIDELDSCFRDIFTVSSILLEVLLTHYNTILPLKNSIDCMCVHIHKYPKNFDVINSIWNIYNIKKGKVLNKSTIYFLKSGRRYKSYFLAISFVTGDLFWRKLSKHIIIKIHNRSANI